MKRILFIAATLAAVAAGAETYWYEPVERVQDGQWTWVDDGDGWRQIYLAPLDVAGAIESQVDSSWWYKPDESSVSGTSVDIMSEKNVKFGTITVMPTDSEQTIANKIKTSGIPSSASGAYAVAVVALAKSLYNELQSKRFEEYFSTMSKSLQSQMLGSLATTYDEVNVQGGKIKIVNSTLLSKTKNLANRVSQIKTLRDNFLTSPTEGQSGTVSIDKQKLFVQGVVSLGGGSGGSSPTDAMSVTNLKYTVVEDNKEVEKSVTTLAGWWNGYGEKGGTDRKNVNGAFLCDFDLTDLTKDPEDDSRKNLNKHYLLTRTGDGRMHYMKMDKQLKAAIKADDNSITTNTEYGAVESGTLSLVGWATGISAAKLSNELLKNPEDVDPEHPEEVMKHSVLVRQIYPKEAETNLVYFDIGDLYKISWSTNWNDAAKDIAAKEAEKVINWNTNWVRLADNIASSQSKMKEYVDNSLDWSTNFFASTADLNGSQTRIKDYIDGQVSMMTNMLSAVQSAIAATEGNISGTRDYIDSLIDFQSNVVISAELAKMNGSIASVKQYVDDVFDWTTNFVLGIEQGRENHTIDSMHTYVRDTFDITTNLVFEVEAGRENGTIESVKQFFEYSFALITNRLSAIDALIDSHTADISSFSDYINMSLAFETNLVIDAKLAEMNGSIKSVKAYVDNTFDYLTNLIHNVEIAQKQGIVDTIGDYTRKVVDINTNTIEVLKDIESLGIDGVETAGDFVKYSYAYQTNLFSAIQNIDKREFAQNITNVYYNVLNEITNWNIITNVFITYLDGKGDAGGGGGGGGGGGDAPLELPPTKDPYKEEFVKEEKTFDYFLPVKNGWMISHMTNDLWGVVNAEHALDNMSLYTNEERRAEIQGYKSATTNKMPVKVKLEQPKTDSDGNPILYGIEWMDYPTALMAITSKDIDKIQKWLKVTQTENIFTLVASNTEKVAMLQTSPYKVINANALLDNASIWTNDNFLAEVKGFQHAGYYSYPIKVMGSNGDEVEWTSIDQPDSLVAFDYGDGERLVYNRSLSRTDDYGISSVSNVWSLYGFNESGAGTIPRIWQDGLGNKALEWTADSIPDSAVVMDYSPYSTRFSSIERADDFGVSSASNVWSVYGFRYAAEGTAPHVHTDEYGNKELKWGLTGNAVRVVGTDGSEAVIGVAAKTNTLTFASASDSNVKATVFGDGAGNVTVTFGVYYLQESDLNGGSGGGSGL